MMHQGQNHMLGHYGAWVPLRLNIAVCLHSAGQHNTLDRTRFDDFTVEIIVGTLRFWFKAVGSAFNELNSVHIDMGSRFQTKKNQ
jgi:hypothetical protein